jgi:hypothetical protein
MARQFIAFPSNDRFHSETISNACKAASTPDVEFAPWVARDDSGSPLGGAVDSWIEESESVIADITYVNDNVTYEIGYAIGLGKPVRLIRNATIPLIDLRSIGLIDTLLYDVFRTQPDLEELLRARSIPRNPWHPQPRNKDQPLFVLSPPNPTTFSTALFSAVKKGTRLKFRSFNPREIARLTAEEAWEQVYSSFGVVVSWSDAQDIDGRRNNQRASLVFGMARGRKIPALLIANYRSTLPLDLRDQCTTFMNESELMDIFRDFREEAQDELNEYTFVPQLQLSLLDSIQCGDAAAENEQDQLSYYFLETEEFKSALEGRTNLVIGRKGSGKSAIFYQIRDRIRINKRNVVIDLSPEGYQLIKLKEMISKLAGTGVRKEFISAFWQYVLWLEIAYKLLEKDDKPARRDYNLLQRYDKLKAAFVARVDTGFGDFSERLRLLTDKIETRLIDHDTTLHNLMSSGVLQIIYGGNIAEIRAEILNYLKQKGRVLFLFDNLDRMRTTGGFDEADAMLILGLVESLQEISKQFRRDKIEFQWVVFIRSDVYQFVVQAMADYGKHAQQSLEWQDKGLLVRVLERRIMSALRGGGENWVSVWHQISVDKVGNRSALDFIINASLMRPRYAIKLFETARRRAINMGNQRISEDDYVNALDEVGWNIVEDIDLELKDIMSSTGSLIFDLGRLNGACDFNELTGAIAKCVGATDAVLKVIDVLLWSGAVGVSSGGPPVFIYDCGYKLQFLKSMIASGAGIEFCLHETLASCLSKAKLN